MYSIFIFKKDGEYQGVITEKDGPRHPLLKDFEESDFYLKKEMREKGSEKKIAVLYKEQQSFGEDGFMQSAKEALERKGFLAYLFDEKKKEIADLLLTSSIGEKEQTEFFDYLVALSLEKAPEIKNGLQEDLKIL